MELIVPDGFDAWFDALFEEAAYHPAGIARRLGLDNETVSAAVLDGELAATRHASGSRVLFAVRRADLRDWLLRSLVVNRPD